LGTYPSLHGTHLLSETLSVLSLDISSIHTYLLVKFKEYFNKVSVHSLSELIQDEKKNQIIKVACELFAKNGYYNTTMPDIAKASGMSVGNLYNYFESKEELAKETMLTVSSL